ncbi:hypothetical protein [Cryobacterium arcticum]|uniref:hypothetical protein n=1 Tax=Cryobacterium arcticum TaxID=670052 RepID=UPI0011B77685|nr:hypothetical protein [Cryobacterium arcticum]
MNANVVRRRTSVVRVDDELVIRRVQFSGAQHAQPSQVLDAIKSFTNAISTFAETDGSPAAVKAVTDAVAAIESLRFRHDSVQILRPDLALARAISRTLAQISLLWEAYKPVLTASTMAESVQLSEGAQALLDGAGESIRKHNARADAVAVFEDHTAGSLSERALKALRVNRPGLSLLEVASLGATEASAEVGVPVADALGAQYLTLIAVAEVHLDIDRFRRVASEAAQFCHKNKLLSEIAAAPEAIQALVEGNRAYAEAITAFEAVLQHEKNETTLIRRIIKLHSEIYEGVGLYQFVWYALLSGMKQKPFHKLVMEGATGAANTLLNSEIAPWFQGSDAYLRHAGQHGGAFSIVDGRVLFKLDKPREPMRVEEVIDTIFTFFESLAATSWALSNALSNAGIEVPTPDADAAYIGMSKFKTAALWLSDRGEGVCRSEEKDNAWEFDLDGVGGVSEIALTLAMAEGTLPHQISVQRHASTDPWLEIPLDMYIAHADMLSAEHTPSEFLISLLKLRASCHSGSQPLAGSGDFRYAIAVLGLFILNSDVTMIRHIRQVEVLARNAGDLDAIKLIHEILLQSRVKDRHAAHRLKAQLNEYVRELELNLPESTRVRIQR